MWSVFENCDGDVWDANATPREFVLSCSDAECVEDIVIKLAAPITYDELLKGVSEMAGPLDATTPSKHGWPRFWVMRFSERLWLQAFLSEAAAAFRLN